MVGRVIQDLDRVARVVERVDPRSDRRLERRLARWRHAQLQSTQASLLREVRVVGPRCSHLAVVALGPHAENRRRRGAAFRRAGASPNDRACRAIRVSPVEVCAAQNTPVRAAGEDEMARLALSLRPGRDASHRRAFRRRGTPVPLPRAPIRALACRGEITVPEAGRGAHPPIGGSTGRGALLRSEEGGVQMSTATTRA